MKFRSFGKIDWQPSALGFGCMRFPVHDDEPARIDEREAARMVEYAVERGVNYLDTAYPYHGGQSELFLGKILKNSLRDKVKIATKLPSWKIKEPADLDRYLNEQLRKLQVEQIDFYLLHALDEGKWEQLLKVDVLNWLEKAQSDGRIDRIGFSFHDQYPVFQKIVDGYQGWDFCQIQYNFMDLNYQAGAKGLRYAAEKDLGVIVMEPIRGGRLVDPPDGVQQIWDQSPVQRTPADWALQWLWNQQEVSLVLSGMNTMQHVKENVASATKSGVGMLTSQELETVEKVRKEYQNLKIIPCTRCGYCMPCPHGVDIPRVLSIYNDLIMYQKPLKAKTEYNQYVPRTSRADFCQECGECEEKCPQDIEIASWMEKVDETLKDI